MSRAPSFKEYLCEIRQGDGNYWLRPGKQRDVFIVILCITLSLSKCRGKNKENLLSSLFL
jgi:hypothetical protein